MYGAALEGYSRAAALNPGWDEPVDKEKQLLDYLRKVTDLMENKVGTQDYLENCTTVYQLLVISNTNAKMLVIHHHLLLDGKLILTSLIGQLSCDAENVNQLKKLTSCLKCYQIDLTPVVFLYALNYIDLNI